MKKALLLLCLTIICFAAQAQQTSLVGLTSAGGTGGGGNIFDIDTDGTNFQEKFAFVDKGENPRSNLLKGTDGKLYGMTTQGGSSGKGVIFSTNPDGTGFIILQNFDGINGANPLGSLIQGTDGKLYGMTQSGGSSDKGVIFSTNPDGTGFIILQNFNQTTGVNPYGSLIQGTDGKLYGMTYGGGSTDAGVIFSTNTDGTGYTILQNFYQTIGVNPYGSLIQGTDGKLYGMTQRGGSSGAGVIFSTNTDGTGYTILQNFNGSNGFFPWGSLIQGTDGKLYGMTYGGGSSSSGVIFRINTDGTGYTILQNFNRTNGANPWGSLLQGTDGKLYGMTQYGGSSVTGSGLGYGVIFSTNTDGTGYTILQNFNLTNGANPLGSLIQGINGKLYGMTYAGGSSDIGTLLSNGGSPGYGVIFSTNTDGIGYTILQNFNNTNGGSPYGSLIQGTDRKLYGMTYAGGSSGLGVIFSTTKDGTGYTILQNFNNTNGAGPSGSLLQGTDGKLYGMTTYGGSSGKGVIFRINTDGTDYTILQNFNGVNGANPEGSLIQDKDGKLYGVTTYGGSSFTLSNPGYGVIFSINTNGTSYAILQNFNRTNGTYPRGSLLQGTYGLLYGMTTQGGNSDFGVIFRINTNGTGYAILQNFNGSNGAYPVGSLIQGTDRKLYGTTNGGGSSSYGVIFSTNTDGTNYTVLQNFNGANGYVPGSSLLQGTDGKLYGMTYAGGSSSTANSSGLGVIFSTNTDGTNYTILQNFNYGNGASPKGSLVLLNNCPVFTFSPSALPNGTTVISYNQTLSVTGGVAPYSYTVLSGTLPAGITLSSAGVLSGTPTTLGTFNFSIQVIDANACTSIQNYSLAVASVPNCPAISISPANSPAGTLGVPFQATLSASGGVAPYSYTVLSGILPTGITLSSAGVISGTPTTSGNFNFSIQTADANVCTGIQNYSLVVASAPNCPAITISPASLSGVLGIPFQITFSASGGVAPYSYTVLSGILPTGITLSSAGVISGTPTTLGTFNFNIQVTDANTCTSIQNYSLAVTSAPNCPTISISPSSISGTTGIPFEFTISASGGVAPYTYSIVSKDEFSLKNLVIDPNTGVLKGVPKSSSNIHENNITIEVKDKNGCITQYTYSKTAGNSNFPCPRDQPYASQTPLNIGYFGAYYLDTVETDMPIPFGYYGAGASLNRPVPPSLYMDGTNGIVSGVLTANGSKNPAGSYYPFPDTYANYRFYSWGVYFSVGDCFPYSNISYTGFAYSNCVTNIHQISLPPMQVGQPFSERLTAESRVEEFITTVQDPYTYAVASGNLPPGLSLTSNGVLAGTPTAAGTYNFHINVMGNPNAPKITNQFYPCGGGRAYTVTVAPSTATTCATLRFSTTQLPDALINVAYSHQFAIEGGNPPYMYALSEPTKTSFRSLPVSISFNPTTGILSGTFPYPYSIPPITPQAYNNSFEIKATDANGCVVSRFFSIISKNKACPAIGLAPAQLSNATQSVTYQQQLTASGGNTPYSFLLNSGSLPEGLILNTSGLISGTISSTTLATPYNFEVKVVDGNSCSSTKMFTLLVEENTSGPSILPNATVGTGYNYTLNTGTTPKTYSLTSGSLPTGLYLEGTYGVIFGIPQVSGTYNFTLAATTPQGATTFKDYTLLINCPNAQITSALPNSSIGSSYLQNLTTTGGSGSYLYSVSNGSLPDGLYLDGSSGAIFGSPTKTGSFTFVITSLDTKSCQTSQSFTLTISCPNFVINSSLPDNVTGNGYLQNLTSTGGRGDVIYSVTSGSLPTGLYLDGFYGAIFGVSSQTGSFSFTLTATDNKGCQTSKTFTLTITPSAGRIAKSKSLEEKDEKGSFIYPNPTADRFYLRLVNSGKVSLKIIDIFAREVLSEKYELQVDEIIQCDIKHLAAGTYFVKTFDGSKSQTFKLIKQ